MLSQSLIKLFVLIDDSRPLELRAHHCFGSACKLVHLSWMAQRPDHLLAQFIDISRLEEKRLIGQYSPIFRQITGDQGVFNAAASRSVAAIAS